MGEEVSDGATCPRPSLFSCELTGFTQRDSHPLHANKVASAGAATVLMQPHRQHSVRMDSRGTGHQLTYPQAAC